MAESPLVECVFEDARWDGERLGVWAERAAHETLEYVGLPADGFEIALLACDDVRISGLNTEFRGKSLPTNVLSWPAWDLSAEEDGAIPNLPDPGTPDMPESLGDIALAYDTCAQEAREQGKKFEDHVTHLIVHSVLHLLGYDHIRDKDAALMEKTEALVLAQLGVENPYEVRADLLP